MDVSSEGVTMFRLVLAMEGNGEQYTCILYVLSFQRQLVSPSSAVVRKLEHCNGDACVGWREKECGITGSRRRLYRTAQSSTIIKRSWVHRSAGRGWFLAGKKDLTKFRLF